MGPPVIESSRVEKEAILEAAKLMLVAARTAPKTAGIDDIVSSIVYGEEKDRIARKMESIGEERRIEGFESSF